MSSSASDSESDISCDTPSDRGTGTKYMLNPSGKSDQDKGFFDDPDDNPVLTQQMSAASAVRFLMFNSVFITSE